MRFKAVFLDAGETMIHPHPTFGELFARVLDDAGHRVEIERILETVSVYSKRWIDTAKDRGRGAWSVSSEASKTFWLEIYEGFLKDLGIDADPPALSEMAMRMYSTFSDPASYRAYPDVLPGLAALAERGYVLGLVSNFEEWLELVLEAVELTPYLPVRVISGVEGIEKPDPRIFELALERTGVAAEDSVYVGDHLDFDVEASRAVGMFPVLIDRRDRYPDADCARITRLDELPELLEKA